MKPTESVAGCLARSLAFAAALALGILGLLFLVAASARNAFSRVVIGSLLVLAAIAIGLLAVQAYLRVRDAAEDSPAARLPAISEARCPSCGRRLEDQPTHMQGAAAVVRCPACGGTYRLEERPKW